MIIAKEKIKEGEDTVHETKGVELMGGDISFARLKAALINTMSRETVLRQYLDTLKENYDYILLDCSPSLGMLTVNALVESDSVLIPVQAQYL